MDTQQIKQLLYLETAITSVIHNAVEELLRGKVVDIEKLKESITYQLEEKLKR